jgi:hypothetical protein
MDLSSIAVSTITWARDDDEERLLRGALRKLGELGAPVAVADKGVRRGFTDFLRTLPGFTVTVPDSRSLVEQVRASLDLAGARNRKYVLYTEPDKALFFDGMLADFIDSAPDRADVGAVLAARSPAGFATFPPLQQYTEDTINRLCGHLIGVDGDYSYGPFLLNSSLATLVQHVANDAGWGWRHFVFGAAHRLGYRVLHVHGHYECPPDQRTETDDDRLHRIRQLGQNVQGLLAGVAWRGTAGRSS